jgi:hypothetical protein
MGMLESMGLKLRKKGSGSGSSPVEERSSDGEETKQKAGNYGLYLVLVWGLLVALAVAFSPQAMQQASGTTSVRASTSSTSTKPDTSKAVDDGSLKLTIGDEVQLSFKMNKINENDKEVSLGPHVAKVTILKPNCSHPRIYMRLKGEALVSIPLQESETKTWSASFYMPVAGKYELDARWYGCDNNSDAYTSLPESLVFQASGTNNGESQMVKSKTPLAVFPTGFWRSKQHFKEQVESIKSDYLWVSNNNGTTTVVDNKLYQAKSDKGEAATVLMQGSPVSDGFSKLSNYEVVCWVGTDTAAIARETFLSLRGQLSSGQRPFKFHYQKITDLSDPENSMNEKKMSRKCKQTWVMMDEMEGVSQAEYKKQVVNFLQGIAKCMHDETWSIWMFTVNTNSEKACHSATSKKTHHHPCNDALFEIFEENILPSNVRLVDNTDVSNAQMGENSQDVAATIAMRIAALIGKQVDTWRAAGQIGKVTGLHRGKKLEVDPADQCQFSPPV